MVEIGHEVLPHDACPLVGRHLVEVRRGDQPRYVSHLPRLLPTGVGPMVRAPRSSGPTPHCSAVSQGRNGIPEMGGNPLVRWHGRHPARASAVRRGTPRHRRIPRPDSSATGSASSPGLERDGKRYATDLRQYFAWCAQVSLDHPLRQGS
jgi:hypothetical protein